MLVNTKAVAVTRFLGSFALDCAIVLLSLLIMVAGIIVDRSHVTVVGALVLLVVVIFGMVLLARTGQTVGQIVAGIRTVDRSTGAPPGAALRTSLPKATTSTSLDPEYLGRTSTARHDD